MKSLFYSRTAQWSVLIVVLVGILAVAGAALMSSADTGSAGNVPVGVVSRGPLTISVAESGTIKSREQEVIKSEVEGTATILYLIPEGTRVKKGELLVELDATKLEDQKISQQIVVQNAEAAAISARENLEVVKSQAKSDIAKAQLDYQFAKEDLEKYIKGDFETEKKRAESEITLAESNLKQAEFKAEWSEKLYKENYLSKTELEADRQALLNAQIKLELAKNSLALLLDFTYKRKVAELTAAVEQAEMALERITRKAAADIVQAEASLRAKESELARQKMVLDKINTMIEKAKIYAPTDGLVVYATTGGGFRGDREPLDEGQTVRERQELIYLPTANSAMAEIKVHESSLDKVRVGLPVRVTVDAVPNKVFTGHVAKIAPLPDPQSFWQNPDLKVFNTEIWLEGENTELRTGMTCRAEIIVDHYTDTLYVPVHAVVRVGGKPVVYVAKGDGFEPREVEVGLDNNRMIRVISGLQAGERISLAPPLADATASAEEDAAAASASTVELLNQAKQPQTQPAGRLPMRPGEGPAMRPGEGPAMRPGEGPAMRPGEGPAMRPGEGPAMRPGEGPAMRPGAAGDQQRGPGGRGFERRGNRTPEQIEERRKQFESMSPEERQKLMEQFRQQRRQRNPGGTSGENPRP